MNKKKLYTFLICDKETGDVKGYLFSCNYGMIDTFNSEKFFLHFEDVSFVPSDSDFSKVKHATLYNLDIQLENPEV